MSVFEKYAQYYDILYKDKDYETETAYIVNLLKQHGVQNGNLLELGAGTGKHALALIKHGYTVDAIERSPEMISTAPAVAGLSWYQSDIRNFSTQRKYNAVLALFHVMSYQISNADVHSVFSRAAEHTKPGGIFLFDFWYSAAVHSQKPSTRVKRMRDEKFEITRIAEPKCFPHENRVEVNYTVFAREREGDKIINFFELHTLRHFSLLEIDLFAEKLGFRRIAAEEFLTGDDPSEMTWGVCVVLQRSVL